MSTRCSSDVRREAGEVYPGYGTVGGSGGYYTGYYPGPSQDTIFNIFLRPGPTHGRMKVNLKILMRFPKMGLDMGPE